MLTAPAPLNRFSYFKIASYGRMLTSILLLLLAAALSGCAGDFVNMPTSTGTGNVVQVPIGNLSGSVYGGQSPIWQSHVYLMKATTTGYGRPSQSLLAAGANTTADTTVLGTAANPAYYVTTDSTGNFNITGDYSCSYNSTTPSQSDQLYLVSLSGNATFIPGPPASGGVTNPLIGLMSVLGQCPSDGTFAGHLRYIIMNEVSTVATAYALAGFASNSYTISSGSSTQAKLGLANAMANANQIYDIQNTSNGSTHEARTVTPNGNGTVPQTLVDTIANILASCINLGNTTTAPTSGNCYKLNSNTGNPGSGYNVTSSPGGYTVATQGEVNNGSTGFTFTYTTSSANTLYVGEWVNVTGNPSASFGFNNYGVITATVPASNSFSFFVPYNQNANLGNGTPTIAPVAASGVTAIVGTDTASAAIYMAQHPASNVAALYALQASNVQFSDDLASQPNDFSLGIVYSMTGANGTAGVAIDASGNAFVTSQNTSTSLIKLSPLGVQLFGPVGSVGGYYSSIDVAGNVWVPGQAGSSVMEYNNAGTVYTGSPYTAGGALSAPQATANDPTGSYTYIANSNGTPPTLSNGPNGNVVRIAGPVSAPTATTYTSGGMFAANNYPSPNFIAVDQAGDFWVTFGGSASTSNTVGRFGSTGTQVFRSAVGSLTAPDTIAIDSAGNGWVAFQSSTPTLSKLVPSGSTFTYTSYTGGGLNIPRVAVIDGANNVFVSNQSGNSVSEFNSAGTAISSSPAFSGNASINTGVGLAADPSGDIWMTSYGNSTVVEFIGLSAPVVTPIASAMAIAVNSTGNKP